VTAYIKEGSSPSSLVTRYITFEYITAQAAARRAQNFAGVMACLAGGAQLHSRANIEAIGGAIDTSSLAEDTFTTLKTQLSGKRVIFDANATVWAEEPASLTSLWKQRLRWARGNLQITLSFRKLWFNPKRHSKLGSVPFGILWFSIVFLPLFMVFASLGLIGMYEFYPGLAWNAFGMFWGSTVGVYLFETLYSFAIDPVTARRAWLEGLIFPGIISLGVMTVFFVPPHLVQFLQHPVSAGLRSWESNVLALLIYSWAALSMLAAWAVYRLERAGAPGWLCSILLVAVGYGPQLCAISLAALIAHCRKAESRWDKTVKSGRVKMLQ
jgi:cellulose synthase/poly-beta-1,6-N-acetylglucosamine synthase-like glycosyltransferase